MKDRTIHSYKNPKAKSYRQILKEQAEKKGKKLTDAEIAHLKRTSALLSK